MPWPLHFKWRKEKQPLNGKDRDGEKMRAREMLMKAERREYKLKSQQLCRGLRGRLSRPSSMSALIMGLEQCSPLWAGYFTILSSCPTRPPAPLARSISHKHSLYRYECTLINHKSRQRDTLNHHICLVILLFGRWGGSELETSKLNGNTSRWVSLFDTGASYNPESTRPALNNIHRGKEKVNYFRPQKYNTPELLAYVSALFCFETRIQSHNLLVMLTIKHAVHTVLL